MHERRSRSRLSANIRRRDLLRGGILRIAVEPAQGGRS